MVSKRFRMYKVFIYSSLLFMLYVHEGYSCKYEDIHKFKAGKQTPNPPISCNLPQALKIEISAYKEVANKIINEATNGAFKGRVYSELAVFADKFGHRLVGSDALENSIDYLVDYMGKQPGLKNVRKEPIQTPLWTRGKESLKMVEPRQMEFSILSFGYSIGTPPEGLQAEILVATSFEDLESKADQAKGKIIVFNQGYSSYGDGHLYRGGGAPAAAKVGGIAVLIRSITPFSLETPHTGMMKYEDDVEKIPCVGITVETADMLLRMSERNETVTLHLQTEAKNYDEPFTSHNAMGDLEGITYPDEIVVVSGHIDSWDVGQGVVDDAAGVFVSIEVLNLLKSLNLIPKRTIEAIAWTSEENGLYGALGFMKQHGNQISKYVAAFESDTGTFKPLGLDFAGNDTAGCVVQEILKLLEPINATTFRSYPIVGTDIMYMTEQGVPSLSLSTDGMETDLYFYYHHSIGDTMTLLNSDHLDLCLALWAVSSYVIADIKDALNNLPEQEPLVTSTVDSDNGISTSTTEGDSDSGSNIITVNVIFVILPIMSTLYKLRIV